MPRTRALPLLLATLLLACDDGGGDNPSMTWTSATGVTSASTPGSGDTTTDLPTSDGSSSSDAASTDVTSTSDAASTSGVAPESTGGTTGEDSDDMSTGGVGTTGDMPAMDLPQAEPIPVKEIPGLASITFYETTGEIKEYTFNVDGLKLNNLLQDPLSADNCDIQGTPVEFYDVYYSDIDGNFDPLGSYLTIAGSFGATKPAGGGLNLAEISLNYEADPPEFGSYLASFVGLGDNYAPGSEVNAIDGNLMTHTTMGNTVNTPGQRLRVTLGFKSSLAPG